MDSLEVQACEIDPLVFTHTLVHKRHGTYQILAFDRTVTKHICLYQKPTKMINLYDCEMNLSVGQIHDLWTYINDI